MSLSSEFSHSSIDLRLKPSYKLFVERVAKFLNDHSCAWASISLERRESMMHERHCFPSASLLWECGVSRFLAVCCTLPRFVKFSPRSTTRTLDGTRQDNLLGVLSNTFYRLRPLCQGVLRAMHV